MVTTRAMAAAVAVKAATAKVFTGYTTGGQHRIAVVDAATGAAELLRYRAGGLLPLAALPR